MEALFKGLIMNSLNDREYYTVRAAAARQMAARAEDRRVAAIHYDLAARYAATALQSDRNPTLTLLQAD